MSKHFRAKVNCIFCNEPFELLVWNSINVKLSPEMVDKLISGEVFNPTCPSCGKENPVDYPLQYHDMENQRYVFYVADEGESPQTKEALELASKLFSQTASYTLWKTDSMNSLREIARVWRDGLNDLGVLAAKTTMFMLTVIGGKHGDFAGYSGQNADGSVNFEIYVGEQFTTRTMDRETFENYCAYVEGRRSKILPPNTWVDWSLETGAAATRED